jgi:DedD protein
MAQQDSGPATFNPKHRIIGAIILVALAVIFIPMLLDETQPPTDLKDSPEIPARPSAQAPDTKVVVTPLAQLDAQDKKEPVAAAGPADIAPSAPEPTKVFGGEPLKPVEAPPPAASPAPEKTADKPAAAKSTKTDKAGAKGWVVQVGVYAHRDNAERVESKLKSHGHAVREETVKIATGTAVRLRIGPYRDKAVAQKARDQIEKDTGEKAVVLAYP